MAQCALIALDHKPSLTQGRYCGHEPLHATGQKWTEPGMDEVLASRSTVQASDVSTTGLHL